MHYSIAELNGAALRHARYYQSKLVGLRKKYADTPQQAVQALRKQLPQLQRAYYWLQAQDDRHHDSAEVLVAFIESSIDLVPLVMPFGEWSDWLQTGADTADALGKKREHLLFQSEHASNMFYAGLLDKALDLTLQCVLLAQATGDTQIQARTAYQQALIYQKQGHLVKAQQAVQSARQHYEKLGDWRGIGRVRSFQAQAAIDALDYDTAQALLQQNIALWRENDDLRQMAIEQYQLGVLYNNRQQYAKSQDILQEARIVFQTLHVQRYEAYCLQLLSDAYNETRQYDDALSCIQQAYDLFQQIQDQRGMAICLNQYGLIYFEKGDFAQALRYHQQAVELARAINYLFHIAQGHRSQADIYVWQDDLTSARAHIIQAIEAAQESNITALILYVLITAIAILRADDRLTFANQCIAAIQATTQEPYLLDLLQPHLEDYTPPAQVITIETALTRLFDLYT